MGEAYICDHCGATESGEPIGIATLENTKDGLPVIGGKYPGNRDVELCSDCSKRLEAWMDGKGMIGEKPAEG